MESNPRFLDDFAKLAAGTAGALIDLKSELKQWMEGQIEDALRRAGFVTREEFEVVRELATKAREENASLKNEIEKLQKKS